MDGQGFVLGILTLFATIVVVFVWQIFATARARASAAREEAYTRLAERATEAIEDTSRLQQQLSEGLEELRTRVAAIEKLLREVE